MAMAMAMAMASPSPSSVCYGLRNFSSHTPMLLADRKSSSLPVLRLPSSSSSTAAPAATITAAATTAAAAATTTSSSALLPSPVFPLPSSSSSSSSSDSPFQKHQGEKHQCQHQQNIASVSAKYNHHYIPRSSFSRSGLALLTSFILQEVEEASSSTSNNTAFAFSLGISGPKEWLKGQKRKTSEFLIAPIMASRERLKNAVSLADSNTTSSMEEAQNLVKMAARDCLKPEEGSIIAFQVKTGVEVCTFRLILKNAAALLDDADPIKLSANEALDTLVSSFDSLNDILSNNAVGSSSRRDTIKNAFNQVNIALDGFENGVRECLGIS